MNKIIEILFIMSVIFIGADRINLLPSNLFDFQFSPYLLISLVLVLLILLFKPRDIKFSWLYKNEYLLPSLILFLIFVSISVILSADIYFSFKRFILLLYIIVSLIIILSSFERSKIRNVLYIGSILGSVLFYLFNHFLLQEWIGNIHANNIFINISPDTLGHFIPRLGGFSTDVNRGAFVLVFFTFLIFTTNIKSIISKIVIFLNTFFIMVTLSRSAILLYILTFVIYSLYFLKKKEKINVLALFLFTLFIFYFIVNNLFPLDYVDISSALNERLSISNTNHDSSASIHLKLLVEGFSILMSDIKLFVFGSGHGTSFYLIEGFEMAGKKNANFHSQYLSVFIENGIISVMFFLFLTILYPLYIGLNKYLPLLIGAFFFNLLYQLINEPAYWLMIFIFYISSMKYQNNIKLKL